MPTSPSPHW
jgi:hypothetical protein